MVALDEFHSLSEARSWALHRHVGILLSEQPRLLDGVRSRVDKWLLEPACHPYAKDWKLLLDGNFELLQKALTSKDEKMCTLRQASPFAGVLDSKTRWLILKEPGLRPREES